MISGGGNKRIVFASCPLKNHRGLVDAIKEFKQFTVEVSEDESTVRVPDSEVVERFASICAQYEGGAFSPVVDGNIQDPNKSLAHLYEDGRPERARTVYYLGVQSDSHEKVSWRSLSAP